jgi:hypothetical protein
MALSLIIILGCHSPTDNNKAFWFDPPQIQDSSQITDDNVLKAVYSSYKVPYEFHTEDFTGGSPYYENTVSIHSSTVLWPRWIELSTNDRNQAFAWSESSCAFSTPYLTFQAERETEKYFEFRRIWPDHPSFIILSRVHKTSYLDRSMFDRMNPGDTLGSFRETLVDSIEVKELIEYLWYIENYNLGGAKVLCSYVINQNDYFEYIMFHTGVSYGDYGLYDSINIMRSNFKIAKASGIITHKSQMIRWIKGQKR